MPHPPSPPLPTDTPRSLGRYQLITELARGRFRTVYLGRDPDICRQVVLISLAPPRKLGTRDHDLRELLAHEAHAAGILDHRNIATVHDIGEDLETKARFIVMEYVPGKSLMQLLAERHIFAHDRIAALLGPVAEALDHAHRHGVVHGGLTPARILLTLDGEPKLISFGNAALERRLTSPRKCRAQSASYLSPEQVLGHDIDGRSDLFSLGVVLYELLTRKKLFSADNLTSISYKIVHEQFAPPETYDAAIPPELTTVLEKALSKDPGERFQRGNDFALALYEFQAREEERQMLRDLAELVHGLPGAATADTPSSGSAPSGDDVNLSTPCVSAPPNVQADDDAPPLAAQELDRAGEADDSARREAALSGRRLGDMEGLSGKARDEAAGLSADVATLRQQAEAKAIETSELERRLAVLARELERTEIERRAYLAQAERARAELHEQAIASARADAQQAAGKVTPLVVSVAALHDWCAEQQRHVTANASQVERLATLTARLSKECEDLRVSLLGRQVSAEDSFNSAAGSSRSLLEEANARMKVAIAAKARELEDAERQLDAIAGVNRVLEERVRELMRDKAAAEALAAEHERTLQTATDRELREWAFRVDTGITGIVANVLWPADEGQHMRLPGYSRTLQQTVTSGLNADFHRHLDALATWLVLLNAAREEAFAEWFVGFWSRFCPRLIENDRKPPFASADFKQFWSVFREAAAALELHGEANDAVVAQHLRRLESEKLLELAAAQPGLIPR